MTTEAVISSTSIFVAIANNTLYGSKLYMFLLCQKSLDIKIMFHEDQICKEIDPDDWFCGPGSHMFNEYDLCMHLM